MYNSSEEESTKNLKLAKDSIIFLNFFMVVARVVLWHELGTSECWRNGGCSDSSACSVWPDSFQSSCLVLSLSMILDVTSATSHYTGMFWGYLRWHPAYIVSKEPKAAQWHDPASQPYRSPYRSSAQDFFLCRSFPTTQEEKLKFNPHYSSLYATFIIFKGIKPIN